MSKKIEEIFLENMKSIKENKHEDSDLKKIEADIVKHKKCLSSVSKSINDKISDIKKDLIDYENSKKDLLETFNALNELKDGGNLANNSLSEKTFEIRNSYLFDMMKMDEVETLYNICLSCLLLFLTRFLISHFLIDVSNIEIQLTNLFKMFYGLDITFIHIIYFYLLSVFIISINHLSSRIIRNNFFINLTFCYSIMVLYFLYFTSKITILNLSIINKLVLGCELLRNMVKVLSYFYEVHIKKIHEKYKNPSIYFICKKFSYFFFAPTLIYRCEYPKSKRCSIYNAFFHLINFVLSLAFSFLIFVLHMYPNFKYIEQVDKINLIQIILIYIIDSFLILFILFYGFANSYLNFFAEITCFGDRNFYQNFWICNSPKEFVLKLSLNAYEFNLYVLEPFLTNNLNLSKKISGIFSFLFCCLVMEYIIYVSIGVISPIITILLFLLYTISYFMEKYLRYSEKNALLTFMCISFGMGLSVFSIATESNYPSTHTNGLPYLINLVAKLIK